MGRAAAPRKPAPNAFWEIAPDLSRRLFTLRANHAPLGNYPSRCCQIQLPD
jgi:hypothetical protein